MQKNFNKAPAQSADSAVSQNTQNTDSAVSQNTQKGVAAAKAVRYITVAPVAALIMSVLLFLFLPLGEGRVLFLASALLFLVFVPVIAYPVYRKAPFFKERSRKKERLFAIAMSLIGYVGGIIFAVVLEADKLVILIFTTYLLSALIIGIFSKLFKFNASGHACGVSGPIAILCRFLGAPALFGLLVLPPVFWASLKLKRHTPMQLIAGAVIPVALFNILCVVML